MPRRRTTEDQFRQAVAASISIRDVLGRLGLRPTRGNYAVFYRRVAATGVDCSHFRGQGHLKGQRRVWSPPTPLAQLLVRGSTSGISTGKLKARLVAAGQLVARRARCGLTEWQGEPIPLELEHRNGDRFDNRIANLCLLCPNCHALTPTYRGRNKGRNRVAGLETGR